MYAATTDLSDRLGAPYATLYRSGEADAAADLEQASAEIDGYLRKRYVTPVTAPDALILLKDWCLTLAEERAYARAAGQDFSDKLKRRVDAVRKSLRDAASGVLVIAADAAEAENGLGGAIVIESEPPVFGREDMAGY